jgi:hypothetical protein
MNNATLDMLSIVNNTFLKLNYDCKTQQVSYSIADFGGNVIKRGDYNCIEENKLEINDIPKGAYTLCIVDGDSLTKLRFNKD